MRLPAGLSIWAREHWLELGTILLFLACLAKPGLTGRWASYSSPILIGAFGLVSVLFSETAAVLWCERLPGGRGFFFFPPEVVKGLGAATTALCLITILIG